MRTPKVIIDFSKETDGELNVTAGTIITSMTANANFTTPDPPLADITTAKTAYQNALNNLGNAANSTAVKDAAREALEEILADLGLYVEKESDGDDTIMLSSGFKISKQPEPKGPLPKPENFKITPDGKGEMKLRIKSINGAKSYQWEYKKVTDTAWTVKLSTAAKIFLTGLESGKEYTFRVVPIGTSEIREYSDEISSFVL